MPMDKTLILEPGSIVKIGYTCLLFTFICITAQVLILSNRNSIVIYSLAKKQNLIHSTAPAVNVNQFLYAKRGVPVARSIVAPAVEPLFFKSFQLLCVSKAIVLTVVSFSNRIAIPSLLS